MEHGYFSHLLLAGSKLERLYSVDSWSGRFAKWELDARHYLGRFGERSVIIKGWSHEIAADLAAQGVMLDFAYIDADHRWRAVEQDIAAWRKLVRPGGILCGHDYVDASRTAVIPVVDAFAEQIGSPLFVTSETWASWLVFLPDEGGPK